MRIERILRRKGDKVATVSPGDTVREALGVLDRERIGAVVVLDGGRPAGILSERDVVREIARRGESCLSDRVDAMMTADPQSCAPQDAFDAVLARMTEGRFRHMPVVEDGVMVGIVSIGDVVKARLEELSSERDALHDMVAGR